MLYKSLPNLFSTDFKCVVRVNSSKAVVPYLWQCIDAVLGYRRPATCNTELRVLLIAVYNVAYYF
jgi:hypothetical protein